MNYSIINEARELAGWNAESEAFSVYQAMITLVDRRGKKGKRYSLALILTFVLLAKLAGETTLQGMADWIRFRSDWLQQVLPETRATFPCVATYSNVLRSVDPSQVTQVLMDLLTRVRAEKRAQDEQMHVVLDGKTLRGTQGHRAEDQKKMHHVNLYEAKTGVVLKEHMVAEKEGELTQVEAFLTPLLLQGRIISADALYTQKRFCQSVLAARGDYLLFAKGNQPSVRIEETWDSMSMRTSASNDLILSNVHLGPNALADTLGNFTPASMAQLGAWSFPIHAVYLGIAQGARDEAIRFAQRRRPNSLDKPISSVPHIQEKVAKIELILLQSEAVIFGLVEQYLSDSTSIPASQFAAAKYLVTNHAVEVVDLAMRIVGGASLSLQQPLQRYYRDVRAGLHHPPMDNATFSLLSQQALQES